MLTVAIDPGNDTGWALLEGALLIACGLGDPRACERHRLDRVGRVVVEYPRHTRGRSTPNDLIALAWGGAKWVGRYETLCDYVTILTPTPEKWKGGVPKDIHHERVWGKLMPDEKKLVAPFLYGHLLDLIPAEDRKLYVPPVRGKGVPDRKRHNVFDAVGLGLWSAGRAA